jgi:hypothetical protein
VKSVSLLEEGDQPFRFPPCFKILDFRLQNLNHPNRTFIFRSLPVDTESITTFISLDDYAFGIDDWNALSRLTKLKYLESFVHGPFGANEASLLPKSLETLVFYGIHRTLADDGSNQNLHIEMLNALPPKLTRLGGLWPQKISCAHVIQSLPQSIKILDGWHITPALVNHLPDHLSDLNVQGTLLELPCSFPSNLRNLEIPDFHEMIAEKLPNQLESLKIKKYVSFTGKLIEKIPRSLTLLASIWVNCPIGDDIEHLIMALPPSLKEFRALPNDVDIDSVPTPSHSSSLLPRTIEVLEIGMLDFSQSNMAEWILGLPTRLHTLSISVQHIQTGAFAHMRRLNALHNFTLIVRKTPVTGWAKCIDFKSLPRSLTSLVTIDGDPELKASDITNDCFVYAPVGLNSLTIPISPLLTRDCLAHLPNLDQFWEYHLTVPRFREIGWFEPNESRVDGSKHGWLD